MKKPEEYQQFNLFTDYETLKRKQAEEEVALEREKRMQEAMLDIKKNEGK